MKKDTVKKTTSTKKKAIEEKTTEVVEEVIELTPAEITAEKLKEIHGDVFITTVAGVQVVWRKLKKNLIGGRLVKKVFKKNQIVIAVLAGVMGMSMLAGCGDSGKDESTTAAKSDATEATEATEATDATEAASEEEAIKTTLTVWGPAEDQSPDYGEWLQTTCEAFKKEHPNWDITFEYGTCSEGDAGKTVTQDVSASADVYMFANDQLQTLIDAGAISELGGSTADYVKSTNSQAIVDSITVDGGIYGVPFTTNTWFMYYNKKTFTEDDVKSLDTMLEKGKVSFPLTDSWYIAAFYLANGGTLFGDGTDNDAGINFGGDNGKAVTDYLVDLVNNKNFVNDESGVGISGMISESQFFQQPRLVVRTSSSSHLQDQRQSL